jgi:hypothetical protein
MTLPMSKMQMAAALCRLAVLAGNAHYAALHAREAASAYWEPARKREREREIAANHRLNCPFGPYRYCIHLH